MKRIVLFSMIFVVCVTVLVYWSEAAKSQPASEELPPEEPVRIHYETTEYEDPRVEFCDKPNGDPDGPHSSLKHIREAIEDLKKRSQPVPPSVCLAVASYAKTQDWFGESCPDRDAKAAAQWLRECFVEDWTTDENSTGCQLLGYQETGAYASSDRMRDYLKNNFEDCLWSREQREGLSQAVLEEAVFLLSPTGRSE